jgi:hypothetical protein
MTIISQNLFRRHRGTRGETTEEHETARNDSSNDNQESTSNDNGEATSASSSNNNNVITTSLNRHDVENPLNENNSSINEEEENDDEVQELVIRIPSNSIHSNNNTNNNEPSIQFPNWTLNEEEINNRREAIRTEIEHMQQSNFIHFAVLCLVPTSLLLIVIAAILSEDGECSGDGLTVCEREPRTFVNAFTTRCICDAVMGSVVLMMKNGGEDSSNP